MLGLDVNLREESTSQIPPPSPGGRMLASLSDPVAPNWSVYVFRPTLSTYLKTETGRIVKILPEPHCQVEIDMVKKWRSKVSMFSPRFCSIAAWHASMLGENLIGSCLATFKVQSF